MTTVAVLDTSGVLAGYTHDLPSDYSPKENEVVVPDDCDLEPGRYVFSGGSFRPLGKPGSAMSLKSQPNVMRAIFLGFQAIETRFPGTLPAETKTWLSAFPSTVDFKG